MTTQITDSMTKAVRALEATEANTALVRKVAVRLLAEHAEGLPELLAVRTEATGERARLYLQPRTSEGTRLWARALGADVVVAVEELRDDYRRVFASAELFVDGVTVSVGSCQTYSSAQWAEQSASAVAA